MDYAIRIDFQARGSPHAHATPWIKDAPKLGVDSDDVCNFIDQYISYSTPNYADLAHYPRLPSPQTLIACEFKPNMCSKDKADDATAALLTVRKVLDDNLKTSL